LYIKIGIWVKLVVGSAIGFLYVYQCNNSINNLTTVEDHIEEMEDSNPFDKQSILENMQEIMGRKVWTWPLPLHPTLMDPHKNWNKLEYSQT